MPGTPAWTGSLTKPVDAMTVVSPDVCVNEDRGQGGCVGLHGSSRHQAPLYETANFSHFYEPVFVLLGAFGSRICQLSRFAAVLRLETFLHAAYPAIHGSALLHRVFEASFPSGTVNHDKWALTL